jgi:sulfate adenylyltransferase subunit 1 (EFTu-like GTPase family)
MDTGETRVVIAGHVDHGKSTLVGRLLCDTGQVAPDRVRKVERICRKDGKNFEFAFLLDAFEEEQSQGVTIDYTEIRWAFGGRRFLLIDTPGHREFSKNMATGAPHSHRGVQQHHGRVGGSAGTVPPARQDTGYARHKERHRGRK